MRCLTRLAVIAIVVCQAGVAGGADTIPPGARIVSVRPAIPDGAKAFVEQQRKLEQERNKKPLFGNWFKKKSTQPPGYETQAAQPPKKPSAGKSFWDIFNPRKWGKPKQQPPANPYDGPQAPQMKHLQENTPQSMWTQPGGEKPSGNSAALGQGQPAVEQMPPLSTAAPASQPG